MEVGGPTNSLVTHGKTGEWCFGGEREVKQCCGSEIGNGRVFINVNKRIRLGEVHDRVFFDCFVVFSCSLKKLYSAMLR